MKVKCISNKGYENGLDVGEIYEVISSVHGFYEMINKWGDKRCFEVDRFEIVNESHQQEESAFNDLIDVVGQSFKDKKIFSYGVTIVGISIRFFDKSETVFTLKDVKSGIDFIQSLYKETFVIETIDSISKVNVGAIITLLNGKSSKVTSLHVLGDSLCVDDSDYALDFFVLKGATVEQ